ncbi:hypothetical protein VTJ49DRAFT_4562 [Mycothermus thermophilus]|uniref:Riboflavin kinase n=1 Tax=Humicola insolens TaxID=85995 RepID=A0ABR3VMF0_HUMIN
MATPTPNRPLIVGDPSGPSPPYPLRMEGRVISGFGRGSKELGIPTANLPVDDTQTPWISSTPSGVYFGWAALRLPADHPDALPTESNPTTTTTSTTTPQDGQPPPPPPSPPTKPLRQGANGFQIYPMVMSIGYNPFYKNTVRSAEVHILHRFQSDFYGAELRLLVLGFVREEKDYSSLDALVADIWFDCDVAKRSLARKGWAPSGVGVVVGVPKGDNGGSDEGEKVVVVSDGTLDGEWLVRPSELVDGDEGKKD